MIASDVTFSISKMESSNFQERLKQLQEVRIIHQEKQLELQKTLSEVGMTLQEAQLVLRRTEDFLLDQPQKRPEYNRHYDRSEIPS